VDEKIKKLDEELARYKEQIRKTRPGPSQEAIKARAIRLLKHKRMFVPYSLSPRFGPFNFCYNHFHFCYLPVAGLLFPIHIIILLVAMPPEIVAAGSHYPFILYQFEIAHLPLRYEEQRNMLYNQTYNLDQVAFAADGLKDAQQTVMSSNLSSSKFTRVHNAHVYAGCFFLSFFSDECNEGSKQGAQGNDENRQN
jgi:hypothetical protein